MSRFVLFAFLIVAGVAVFAAPAAEEYEAIVLVDEADADESDHLRQRRVTCDLLSFGGKVGDSACAANCLSMGKSGGSCRGGVCVCRKDSIKDLWNKRFG